MTTSTLETSEQTKDTAIVRKGEYSRNGDFHKNLDPNWSYYPVYVNKVRLIDELLKKNKVSNGRILDLGCGEGVLVEKYAKEGWNIKGIDKNYASPLVQEGDLTDIPFDDNSIDTMLCLDVLEHLTYLDQGYAMREIKRVIKPNGLLIVSVPNLAHFTARLKFLFKGRLLRTASISHHPGDRPLMEYEHMLGKIGFKTVSTHGIFPTVPPIYRFVRKHPSKSAGLLRWLMHIPFPLSWHFQTILVGRIQKDG